MALYTLKGDSQSIAGWQSGYKSDKSIERIEQTHPWSLMGPSIIGVDSFFLVSILGTSANDFLKGIPVLSLNSLLGNLTPLKTDLSDDTLSNEVKF